MKIELTKLIQVYDPQGIEVVVLKGNNYFVDVCAERTLIVNSCDYAALEIIDVVQSIDYPDNYYMRVLYTSGAVLQVRHNYPSYYRSRSRRYISYFDCNTIRQLTRSKL